jgi:hypothetical protein
MPECVIYVIHGRTKLGVSGELFKICTEVLNSPEAELFGIHVKNCEFELMDLDVFE